MQHNFTAVQSCVQVQSWQDTSASWGCATWFWPCLTPTTTMGSPRASCTAVPVFRFAASKMMLVLQHKGCASKEACLPSMQSLTENLHLPQLFLPEGKAANAICPVQVANNDSSRGVTPEMVVQEVSLILACCVPDLQAHKCSSCYHN